MPAEISSFCESCQSDDGRVFNGEIAIHFPGLSGLKKPIVWVFPKITVCLKCGTAKFIVPEGELQVLATGRRVDGAVVSDSQPTSTAS